ncbi:SEP1 [Symbiodinium necroappetens]|uniref:SEP1 protein n=1 Tax=Symbiodinium necroappetens TaxID=1628268 RepID=A0A812WFI7_9DINO|nr:SEP1 [Symbiodinium necroappetens]
MGLSRSLMEVRVVDVTHDWQEMCKGIQGYIKESLNQGMLDGFEANGIKYYNKYATLKELMGQGGVETVTANYIMLAAGGRPNHGGYPGQGFDFGQGGWATKPR